MASINVVYVEVVTGDLYISKMCKCRSMYLCVSGRGLSFLHSVVVFTVGRCGNL